MFQRLFLLCLCVLSLSGCKTKDKELAKTADQDFVKVFGDTRSADKRSPVPVLAMDHQNLPVTVLYYAKWCPYCTMMLPILDKAKEDLKGKVFFHVVDIDTPDGRIFTAKYRIKPGGIPYMQFYDKYGEFVSDELGGLSEEEFRAKLAKACLQKS